MVNEINYLLRDPWKSAWKDSLTKYGTLKLEVTLLTEYLLLCCNEYNGSDTKNVENSDKKRISRIGINWTKAA